MNRLVNRLFLEPNPSPWVKWVMLPLLVLCLLDPITSSADPAYRLLYTSTVILASVRVLAEFLQASRPKFAVALRVPSTAVLLILAAVFFALSLQAFGIGLLLLIGLLFGISAVVGRLGWRAPFRHALTIVLSFVVAFFGLALLIIFMDDGLVGSWQQAASQTELGVYEPTYLPHGATASQIVVYEGGLGSPEGMSASYSNGLVISEFEVPPGPQVSPGIVDVEGAKEAYFDTLEGDRLLVARIGDTWVNLTGRPDDELLRVAQGLRRVKPPKR